MKKTLSVLLASFLLLGTAATTANAQVNHKGNSKVISMQKEPYYHNEPTLQLGDVSYHVSRLRGLLESLGYESQSQDDSNVFDLSLERAVCAFQTDSGESASGIVDKDMWKAINRRLGRV